MFCKLEDLMINTIFIWNGGEWKKGTQCWGLPRPEHPECNTLIQFKASIKCYPKLGGQFQEKMGQWIPIETNVNVYA
jgi:hypothetical protein